MLLPAVLLCLTIACLAAPAHSERAITVRDLTGSALAPVTAEDAAVVRAVLSQLARSGETQCVMRWLGPASLSCVRGEMTGYAAGENRPPPDAAQRAAAYREMFGDWYVPQDDRNRRHPQPVGAALRERLRAAVAAIAERGSPEPLREDEGVAMDASDEEAAQARERLERARRALPHVDPSWLAPGQRLDDGRGAGCVQVSLSAVSRERDLAFVEVGRVYAPLVGHGETWALELSGSGWRLIASRRTWIS